MLIPQKAFVLNPMVRQYPKINKPQQNTLWLICVPLTGFETLSGTQKILANTTSSDYRQSTW
jgi:hypothetical protein